MKHWAILATATSALALAAACGSSSSSGNNPGNGGENTSSSSGGSSGTPGGSSGAPVVPLDAGSLDLACQSATDCDGGQLCCGTFGVQSTTSVCAAGPCPTGGTASGFAQQLCASAGECPGGYSCLPQPGFTDVSVCVDDDAAPEAFDGNFGQGDGAVFVADSGEPTEEAGGPHDAGHGAKDAETPPVEAGHVVDASSTPDAAEGSHDGATGG